MTKNIMELTYRDFSALVPDSVDTVLLPVGTMEAHGCTNIGTDVTIPEYICKRVAERMNIMIAPAIPYGITRTLLPYPGSMTVSSEAFEAYVTDVLISLFRAGFRNTIVINGHGGHYEPLQKAAKAAWEKTDGKTLVIHWWELCAPVTQRIFGQAGGHSALDETAMVLAADPELVKPEQCDSIKPYLVRKGSYPYPNPAPILLYEDNEGAPMFDVKKAKEYADAVVDFIIAHIEEVMRGWRENLK